MARECASYATEQGPGQRGKAVSTHHVVSIPAKQSHRMCTNTKPCTDTSGGGAEELFPVGKREEGPG